MKIKSSAGFVWGKERSFIVNSIYTRMLEVLVSTWYVILHGESHLALKRHKTVV